MGCAGTVLTNVYPDLILHKHDLRKVYEVSLKIRLQMLIRVKRCDTFIATIVCLLI